MCVIVGIVIMGLWHGRVGQGVVSGVWCGAAETVQVLGTGLGGRRRKTSMEYQLASLDFRGEDLGIGGSIADVGFEM